MLEGFFYPSLSVFGRGSGIFSHSEALQGKLSSNPHELKESVPIKNIILKNFIFKIIKKSVTNQFHSMP